MTQNMTMIAMTDPRNDDKNLWVSWDEYHRLIELLALAVHESGWKFDKILCLARGGLRVGDQLSRIYDCRSPFSQPVRTVKRPGRSRASSTSRNTSR